ncbi:BREX system P-loop protein BrxC [Endozoicomonas euniceicola]|uniref:BREX system P-loop protein BrxC n=1 Tax=Endozoicomonas euniceicola TaxID=1234143 RepID=A0ABY6GSV6_9GAMM|nr:BREX system P-loop protein BrxC [Endozoicomonas euniceicola]UYM15474.1 BREX system P-loop protein BrxC [Endozoicomonas euniceicola]
MSSTMKIEDLFVKKLTRNINGVVKAEQLDKESVSTELDEYVVTEELNRHFRSFFETYTPAVTGMADSSIAGKIGVWVSGFFGSGKSHFIKILSYLLENRAVEQDGMAKKAISFFDGKVDSMLYGDIHSAVNKPTDVMLFNIDSRANTEDREDAILKVFLKVFNEKLGYCGDHAHIAHLERELDKRNQFDSFKAQFAELTASTWEEERDAYDFYRDDMAEALAEATGQSEDSTRQWVEQLEANFPLDIKNFCKWVKDYIDSQDDRNVLFLVDEVGQFIGDNTQMMLKLQTITEELGTICKGRAWVVVTSQADIDAVLGQFTASKGNDFSKIQGRFYTRISLSSSNTNEVIQKRLLEKNEAAKTELARQFAEKGDIIRNQLMFDKTTTAELAGYKDTVSFVDNYPFVPYHYPLVQKVFESIRTKGATGKHLAMGERSLLDAFQSAAKQMRQQDIGVLIPFHCFYSAIDSFLEPAVKRTIEQACALESLTEFDGQILKTLFLIRYVDTVKSTLDNLVTLSINQIDADKINLGKQIEESLNRLERQLLIARNGDEYIFLTNEEKEIENEIRHTDVEAAEQTRKLSEFIFDQVLLRKNQYRYPENKQDFKVSRFCNGHPKDGASLEDLVIKVISPLDINYTQFNEQQCLAHSLESNGCILIKLGENKRLWDELQTFVKTYRFLKVNSGQRPEQEHLIREKSLENNERGKRLRHEFEDLFKQAEFFAIGTRYHSGASAPVGMVEEAYSYVIQNTFAKLSMLQPTSGDINREIQAVLTADDLGQLGLNLDNEQCNPSAVKEVEQFVSLKIELNHPVYVKDIIHQFTHRPYGWPDNEVLLLLARLALAGKINFIFNKDDLPRHRAYDKLTGRRSWSDLRIQRVRQHEERDLSKAAKLHKDLFNKTFTGSGEKALNESLRSELGKWLETLKSCDSKSTTGQFPGKTIIKEGLTLVTGILANKDSYRLIQNLLSSADDLDEFAEDFEDVEDFYSQQFNTWQQLAKALSVEFASNRTALDKNASAARALQQLETIHSSDRPYGKISQVNRLIEQVRAVNQQLLDERRNHGFERIDERISRISQQLDEVKAPDSLRNEALIQLQQARKRIETLHSIAEIFATQKEAEEHEDEAEQKINRYVETERQRLLAEQNKIEAEKKRISEETKNISPKGSPKEQPVRKVAEPKPPVYVKRTISFSPNSVAPKAYIETEEQVEEYLAKIRKELLDAVSAGDRVRIK